MTTGVISVIVPGGNNIPSDENRVMTGRNGAANSPY